MVTGDERGVAPHEAGQASLVAVGVLALVVALAWGVARLGGAVGSVAAAQAVADAAALAGALDGEAAAHEVAERNGARLVGWRESGWVVQVVVERRGQRARATAEAWEAEPTAGGERGAGGRRTGPP